MAVPFSLTWFRDKVPWAAILSILVGGHTIETPRNGLGIRIPQAAGCCRAPGRASEINYTVPYGHRYIPTSLPCQYILKYLHMNGPGSTATRPSVEIHMSIVFHGRSQGPDEDDSDQCLCEVLMFIDREGLRCRVSRLSLHYEGIHGCTVYYIL